jgi:4-hydroxybenzoyl-CoA thioesterase
MSKARAGSGTSTKPAVGSGTEKSVKQRRRVPGVVSVHPFIYEIKPRWGDTDIARIVYTGKIPDYGLMAIEAWAETRMGKNWYEYALDWGFGTPFVSLTVDFKSPMSPRDVVLVKVGIGKIGTKSLTFTVEGRRESNDDVCFEGRYTCVCIDSSKRPALVTIPLDPRLRAAAEQG